MTFDAHANLYVTGDDGRPAQLWIARRAAKKATDPGKLDNLVVGGVAWGETPPLALVREADEEACLEAGLVQQHAVAAGAVELYSDVVEGFQHERIFVFDLALAPEVRPVNRDGEVAGFSLFMRGRRTPVHLILDSLPAHKTVAVREYVADTQGKLRLQFLPGYAPDLNPDELVCSHVKRTGVARAPLRAGETLRSRIEQQLVRLKRMPNLTRSFFMAPSVAYTSDCRVTE